MPGHCAKHLISVISMTCPTMTVLRGGILFIKSRHREITCMGPKVGKLWPQNLNGEHSVSRVTFLLASCVPGKESG